MYRLVCLSILVSGAVGQIVLPGDCNYEDIGGYATGLNVTRMLGTWNQIARISNIMEQGECSSITLEGIHNAVGNLVALNASVIDVFNKTKTYRNGIIEAGPIYGLYSMNVTDFFEGSFVVQATNYTDFAILYSCDTLTPQNATQNATKVVMAWQYHRKAQLSSSEQASIQEFVNVNPDLKNITWRYVKHDKTSCGNSAVSLAIPHILIFLATVFISKEWF